MADFLKEALKEKAVEDPTVRWKDPESWKCLSDEQRDIIHEWHIRRMIDEQKREGSVEARQFHGLYFVGATAGVIYASKFTSANTGNIFLGIAMYIGYILLGVIAAVLIGEIGMSCMSAFMTDVRSSVGRALKTISLVAIWSIIVVLIIVRIKK